MPADLSVDLSALDALFQAATPGEWTQGVTRRDVVFTFAADNLVRSVPVQCSTPENAALIAALHNAWPAIRRRLEIGDAAVEVCDLTADLRALRKAMAACAVGSMTAYHQRLKARNAARARLHALREEKIDA